MNGAVSKVNKEFISHLTRAKRTPSTAATVQVSHALPAVRFSCLLRGSGVSFQDGAAAGKGFLCTPFWGVQICDYSARNHAWCVFSKPCTKLTLHCNHRSGHLKTEYTESLFLLRRHLENRPRCPAVSTSERTAGSAWETWTVAAADGVRCARGRWEINFLLTFESTPFICKHPVYSQSIQRDYNKWRDTMTELQYRVIMCAKLEII